MVYHPEFYMYFWNCIKDLVENGLNESFEKKKNFLINNHMEFLYFNIKKGDKQLLYSEPYLY